MNHELDTKITLVEEETERRDAAINKKLQLTLMSLFSRSNVNETTNIVSDGDVNTEYLLAQICHLMTSRMRCNVKMSGDKARS